MILIPMNYARQWTFTNKSIEPQTTSYCFKTDCFSSFTYRQKGNSIFTNRKNVS